MNFDPTTAAPEGSFDPASAQIDSGPPVRAVLETAVKDNPDEAAKAAKLARQYPLADDVLLRNLRDVEMHAVVDKADKRLSTSPKLAEYMRTSPFVASQAHDDIEPLAKVESILPTLVAASAGQLVLGMAENTWRTPDTVQRLVGYLAGTIEKTGLPRYLNPVRGVQDIIRVFSEGRLPVGPKLFEGTTDVANAVGRAQNILSEDKDTFGTAFADVGALNKNADQALKTALDTGDVSQLGQVISDPKYWASFMAQAAPSLYAAIKSGGSTAFLAWMEGMEQSSNAADFEQRTGVKISDAEFAQATMQTAIVNGTLERMGLDRVLGAQGKGLSGIVRAMFTEGGTEALQQLNSNLSALLAYDEGKSLLEGVVGSFMGGVGSGGGAATAASAAAKAQQILDNRLRQNAHAERGAQTLQSAFVAATESKLRQRNPETFRDLVGQMAQDANGEPQSIYIDGQVLAQAVQSIPAEELQQAFPNLQEQIRDAVTTNSVVEIPVADALTVAPGTPLEQVFLQNARLAPDALSLAEAQQAGEQAQQFIAQEADRVMQQAADQSAWQQSTEAVKTTILDQLNTAGRFTPDVNEAYSTLVRDFYSVTANRLGITPEEMYQRYPLRVGAAGQQGQSGVLDQGDMTEDQYIARINPTGKRLESSARPSLYLGDIEGAMPLDAKPIGGKFKTKDGRAVKLHRNTQDGSVWATVAGKEVGFMQPLSEGETDLNVVQEFQGQGIGALLSYEYRKANPFAASGGLTEAGERTARAAFRKMQADGVFNQSPAFDGTETGNTPIGDATEIEVDGQMRPALNSTGKPIHPTQEGIRNFWRWFGDSKVVDASGRPLVVYHGTTKNFDVFDASKSKTTGIFFAAYPDYANIVAELDGAREGGGAVVPAYLRIENPATVLSREFSRADTKNAKSNGRDGLITFDDQGKPSQLTVFSGDQIKSATGNTGAFNPADASVLNQQARGTFNPQQLLITLGESSDLSTFLHESGHFFLEVMADLASQPNAPAEVQDDMGKLLKWFGIKGSEIVGGADSGAPLAQGATMGEQFPVVAPGTRVDGRVVRDDVPNYGSIDASLNDYEVLDGIREVPMTAFDASYIESIKPERLDERTRNLAAAIRESGEINPLIVAVDSKGAYIIEGGHRFDALIASGAKSIPAVVVVDLEDAPGTYAQNGNLPTDNTQPAGRTPLEVWNAMTLDQKRPHHERFAESFEQYLLEGKAPNQELQPLFRRFRAWMVNVYKSLTEFMRGRDLRLSDEVRQVFDRMLATDEQIRQAEEAAGMLPDFDATNEAVEKLQSRSLRDLKWTVNARSRAIKALQKDAATLRKGVQEEVRAEVEQQPVYRAINFLRYGKLVQEGMSNTERKALDKAAGMNVKLDLPALKEMYGDGPAAPWRYLSTGKTGLAASEGVHPDIVADMLGFESGDDLVRQILAAEDIKSVVEGITDQRMLERHGDLATPEAIEQAANEAVHNEARARSLATELKAQSEMMNQRQDTGRTDVRGRSITVNAITTAAKEFAQNLAARRRVKDLRKAAWQHRSAEARAGKAWQAATAKGDTQAAVQAKRDQLLNNYSAKALQEAQAEARKILEFFGKITKGNNEKLVKGGRDPDVVNAMRAILAAYGIAPRTGKSALEYLDVLQSNDPSMYAALQPSIAGAMNNAKPVDELTMEELRGLRDEIDAMWHLAKRSRQMEVDGNLLDIEDAAEELQARMQEIGVPLAIPGEGKAITKKEERARKLQHFGSLLRRAEQWAEGMDGSFGGPFLRLVFQPVKEAANRYRADRVKYRKTYQALIDQVAPTLTKGKIDAPEIGYTFGEGHNGIGHAELLHAILHTGNASNKRKLLLGRKWASENADGTLDTSRWDAFIQRMHDTGVLNKTHYDFAQGVWDLLEQTKPLAQKTHRDVFGRYFAEVTADSFETPFGSYRGGYVPAQADPRIVQDADLRKLAELENENMAYSFPSTNRGFTNTRVEYNRPLMLDLRTIGQHIDKVLLFSHMEPSVRDVNKLLSQKGVAYSLGRIDPTIYAGMLTPWLSRAARQIVETPAVGDGGLSRILSTARSRSGMALMIANVSNALQQVTGFFPAFAKLKSDGLNSHMMRATAQYISNPKEMARNVADASQFMENRMENEIAAMNDAMDQILLDPNLYEKAQAWTQKHAYFMQTAMANTMEPIIWTAGYNGALEKGMSEKDAVRYADGLIRQTQGSTLPEDVSQFETGSALKRMFVQFMGYFNMQANTNATGLKQIAQSVGLRKGAGKALLLVTVGPLASIWVAEAIAQAMRGGPDDEDDDGYLDDWLAAVFGFGTIKGALAMVPGVNIVGQAVLNRFNSNPADDKFSLSPAVSLLESAASSPFSVYEAIANDGSKRKAVRDVGALVSMATGLPAVAVARPLGYLAGVADDRIEPTGPVDAVRGLVTGTASPESKNP